MATSGRQWREKTVEEVTLKSGNVAKLRKPDLMSIIGTEGSIPDVFIEFVQKIDMSKGEVADSELVALVQHLPKLWQYLDRLVTAAFVEPRIVDNPVEDDEIALADVDMSEKIEVFTWVMKGVAPLMQVGASFLKK